MMLKVEREAVMLLQRFIHGGKAPHGVDPDYLRCLKRSWHCNVHEEAAAAAAAAAVVHGGISAEKSAITLQSCQSI